MKKLRFFLPVVAFLFAVAAAFAGNVISRDVVFEEPAETTECDPCFDNIDNNCIQNGSEPCECTILMVGVFEAANDQCDPLFRN